MRNAIICDIDLTLLDSSLPIKLKNDAMERLPVYKAWDYFYDNLHLCERNEWCFFLLEQITLNSDLKVIFITGREERARDITKSYLKFSHKIDYDLYMRPNGCTEDDSIVKERILDELVKDYNFLFALDDKNKNCLVYKKFNITPLQVIL